MSNYLDLAKQYSKAGYSVIPVTSEKVPAIRDWSNFQPLCSYKNRNIKRDNIYPVTNLELNITHE